MYIDKKISSKLRNFISIAVLFLIIAPPRTTFTNTDQTRAQVSSTDAQVPSAATSYGQLPLSFIPNAGQSDAVVLYQARAMGGMVFFINDAVVLSLPNTGGIQQKGDQTQTIVQLHLDGADSAHKVVNAERMPGTVNYFIGNKPSQWHINLPTYAGIVYKQLYPGIDLRYDGSTMALKGTYTLVAHANPALIRWHYEGATSVRVDTQTGDLLLILNDGTILTEKAPTAWQTRNGSRVKVTVQYALMEHGNIGFRLGDYDPYESLTIDPTLIYSTFIGGGSFDGAKSIAVDFAGNAYITGVTHSIDFPTKNPLENSLNGDTDAFIVKINPSGTALDYATYLGGSNGEDEFGAERAGGIAVDSNGNAYVTGCTNSADFPTVNPIQPIHGETTNCDVYISKLNPEGNALIYSTYLGDSGAEAANAIAVDKQGSAYIVGDAGKGFPGNPFTNSGHVFVVKVNSEGSAIAFSMFLGGSSYEYATDVAVDSDYNVYVVGNTFSTDFPMLNPAQPIKGGGSSNQHDGFVTKINPEGSGLVYSTYLGGSKTDEASGIALDDLGNAYITGMTQSIDFPTNNAYQPTYGGERGDAFATKLSAAGNEFIYSTYLGGNDDENYFSGHGPYGGIAVDADHNATVTGYTCSANFPTIVSFLEGNIGSCFAFVTRLNATGNALFYSTLIGTQSGGSNDALSTDIALDSQGYVYIVGETNATDFLTKNPLQTTYAGMYDAFVTKFDPLTRVFLPLTARSPLQVATLEVTSPNGTEQWLPGTTHSISWTQSGLKGTVTIELQKSGTFMSQLGTAGATAGIFAWTIPSGQDAGNDYRVRIFQGTVEDISNANFSIVSVRKDDLLGSWSSGVWSLNSDIGGWTNITTSIANQIAAGDMDGDGKADLVVDLSGSGLWVKYSSTGQWQFIASSPTWIAVGDYSGDGKADLAGIWSGLIWLRDSAIGSWTPGTSGATQIALGDMDGDGKADLIENLPSSGVWVTYSSTGVWTNLSADSATFITEGDFNGDGKDDLAGIWSDVVKWRDSVTGSWTQINTSSTATLIAAGDLDGDGKADLIVNYLVSGVWVLSSSTGAWSNLSGSTAIWITTGKMR
jgi:hypothetical protein